jgi:predicted lipoprotein with Yx(FWY)xxD motif
MPTGGKEDTPMKIPVLATALITAVALAAPAEAASKKRKQMQQQKPAIVQPNGYTVYDFDGRVAGRDPDPNIRAAIRKDPRPWEGID